MPEISESLSHKIGPLPAWGWGLAIGGAVIVAKMLSGRSAFSGGGSTGTPAVVGGGGLDNSTVDSTQLSDLTKQVADLGSANTNIATIQSLLIRLSQAVNERATILYYREQADRRLVDLNLLYNSGRVDKATYDKNKALYEHDVNLWYSKNAAINTTIVDLQRQITAARSV